MKPICTSLAAALVLSILGGCAANAGGTPAEQAARQEADKKKQAELAEMEKVGKRD